MDDKLFKMDAHRKTRSTLHNAYIFSDLFHYWWSYFLFLCQYIQFSCLLQLLLFHIHSFKADWHLQGAGLKLTKFLPPSSDDEISEESIQSPRVQEMKDEEIQDSPRSCIIPPPCKPPRSWDLIQSGVIDGPKVGMSM